MKRTILQLTFILMALLAVQTADAQQMTFESNDWIDQYGEHHGPRPENGGRYETINFTNQGYAIRHTGHGGAVTLRYKYTLTQNNTHYYYLATNDMLNGKEFINYQFVLMVTTDFHTLNLMNLDGAGRPTITDVYYRVN